MLDTLQVGLLHAAIWWAVDSKLDIAMMHVHGRLPDQPQPFSCLGHSALICRGM